MFYSNELLSLKKGRFGILWLAATRGTVHVNKRDVMSVNIAQSSYAFFLGLTLLGKNY